MKPRRYIMGALSELLEDKGGISDTNRTGIPCTLHEPKVELMERHSQLLRSLPLSDMPHEDVAERQKIILKVFNCKHIKYSLDKAPAELKLAVIACRAWLKCDRESFASLVTPLVYCMLSCSSLLPMPNVSTSYTLEDQDSLDRLHSLAQWQCMLHHVIALNQLLSNAFLYTSPAKLFSCSVFEHFRQHPAPLPMEERPSVLITIITKE